MKEKATLKENEVLKNQLSAMYRALDKLILLLVNSRLKNVTKYLYKYEKSLQILPTRTITELFYEATRHFIKNPKNLYVFDFGSGIGNLLFTLNQIIPYFKFDPALKTTNFVGIERIPQFNDIARELLSENPCVNLLQMDMIRSCDRRVMPKVESRLLVEIGKALEKQQKEKTQIVVYCKKLYKDTVMQSNLERLMFTIFPTDTIFIFPSNTNVYSGIKSGIRIYNNQICKKINQTIVNK